MPCLKYSPIIVFLGSILLHISGLDIFASSLAVTFLVTPTGKADVDPMNVESNSDTFTPFVVDGLLVSVPFDTNPDICDS